MDEWGVNGPFNTSKFDMSVTDSPVHLGGSRPATEQRQRDRARRAGAGGGYDNGASMDGRPATTNSPGKTEGREKFDLTDLEGRNPMGQLSPGGRNKSDFPTGANTVQEHFPARGPIPDPLDLHRVDAGNYMQGAKYQEGTIYASGHADRIGAPNGLNELSAGPAQNKAMIEGIYGENYGFFGECDGTFESKDKKYNSNTMNERAESPHLKNQYRANLEKKMAQGE